ncbi:MAG: hypothetical protein N2112_11480 [Gemmataceae bacterium]|jgi:squalene-hopene/tetraprenyl-beta-curcumene cyclase|nr:hypothetical protein [Gemmataceae bacterium]
MKLWTVGLCSLMLAFPVFAQKTSVEQKQIDELVNKAADFLKSKQKESGAFEPLRAGPGATALITAGLIRHGRTKDDPVVKAGIKYLESNIQKDGGIYNKFLANYCTCVSLIAFKEANDKGEYTEVIKKATAFLRTLQNDENEKELKFGGVGYEGKGMTADVSNQHFFIEALITAGVPKDDPAIKKALVFLSRCQNLPGPEANDQPFAKKTTDKDKGGFVYNPFQADNPKSDKRTPEGGLRSEGGMTYAGLKSFLYAGVSKEDIRVKSAINWIRENYTLTENPGMKDAGLYYYYHTFAKAMDALGEDEFVDAKGNKHDWRKELFEVLKSKQNADGSWTNPNGAFLENSPELSTSYALLALSYCKPAKKK